MILITGATGLNGAAAVREFARRGEPVRALVRDHDRAKALVGSAPIEVVEGDMLRPASLGAALDGIERVLMISSADPRLVETQCTFIDAAKRAGVRHIVKFSGIGAALDSGFRFTRMHAEIEAYLEASGLAWTHLRPSQFMQVYFREVRTIVAEGAFYLPLGDARLAPVDVDDIAKVAFAVLHGEGHESKRYSMTGPETLTMGEIAERLTPVVGRRIRYVDVAPQEKHRTLIAAGIPAAFADAMDELFEDRRRGNQEATVDLSTHEALGVTPTTFAEFAQRHASVFRGEHAPSHLWASGWESGTDVRNLRATGATTA
jgi:uncharacterized protein YbjT (DUF2867 family)